MDALDEKKHRKVKLHMTHKEALKIAKPILFNTEMVRAIQDGRKTITRRVIKPQPPSEMPSDHNICKMPIMTKNGLQNLWYMDVVEQYPFKQTRYFEKIAPYEIGDILYVRETWNKCKLGSETEWHYEYRANCNDPNYFSNGFSAVWRPSIHMHKEAARIFLRVTDVRLERLQEITITDLQDEGILPDGYVSQYAFCTTDAFEKFQNVWNSAVKKSDLDKYGWAVNPWVWVIEFERVEVTGGT